MDSLVGNLRGAQETFVASLTDHIYLAHVLAVLSPDLSTEPRVQAALRRWLDRQPCLQHRWRGWLETLVVSVRKPLGTE